MRVLCLIAVLVCGSWCSAAEPTKYTVESKLEPRVYVVEVKLRDMEARVAKLESKPTSAGVCQCQDGGRCVCGEVCNCPAKAAAPKLVQWYYNGSAVWLPEGYSQPGGVRAESSAATWDCSSGVCRPVSSAGYGSGAAYSPAPAYSYGSFGAGGGGCSSGNCQPASSARAGLFRRR